MAKFCSFLINNWSHVFTFSICSSSSTTNATFNIADQHLMIPKILISISATNPTYILHIMPEEVVLWQLWWPFRNNQKLSIMTSKLILWKILFHILMLQHNLIKTHPNLHVNVTIAYREFGVPGNIQSRPGHCNCLETKTHQPWHDGIMEQRTQSMDFATQKCGLKND